MVVARRRRRRRPIVPVLALVLTVVVLATWAAGGDKGDNERASALAWLDAIRPSVERSTQLGLEFADVRASVAQLDRPALTRRLDRLVKEARAVVGDVSRAEFPPSIGDARALVVSTMVIRARAVEAMRPALEAALGTGPPAEAAAALAAVGSDLAAADRTYELFVEAVPSAQRVAVVPSKWITQGDLWDPAALDVFVRSLRASRQPGPVHDVAVVTVGLDPPAVAKEGAADVLPVTRSLRLEVVVANVGNVAESRVTVVAILTLPDGTVDTARQFMSLDPGQRQVVQLGGLAPVAGASMPLTVRVEPVEGETAVADNEQARTIVVRDPAATTTTAAPPPAG